MDFVGNLFYESSCITGIALRGLSLKLWMVLKYSLIDLKSTKRS